ncbi:tail completion protein gp17 [Sphingomonas nostoxanthinifaciens]|uniref:tail completion protein gp17 n=1 Tax=Sphingomonas nostoxanthinifaciens TaxID=2872652 RepID=UPI001CC1F39F|nr:hypothetical protein [Sphingomonas nostoxanthinifaciens]UAK25863.1 hypothetical protein K8P63_07005 [Sphingomonas nostoxanthinifaciens]
MTGAIIVGTLLRASAAMVAAVPIERIKLGLLPDGVPLPAVVIRTISSVDRQPLKRGASVRVTDRVSVTVRAASYRDQTAIIELIRTACAGRIGDVGGGRRVSILTAGTGPDLAGPANSFEQSQDFRVSFDADA